MIRKYLAPFLLISFFFTPLSAQDKLTFDLGAGYFLRNSENGLNIMYDKNYKEYYIAGLAWQVNNVSGYNMLFEYNFQYIRKNNITKLQSTDAEGNVFDTFPLDVALINHFLDIDFYDPYTENISFAWGPSLVLTHRIIEISDLPKVTEISKDSFYDRLASFGLGINGLVEYKISVDTDMSFISKLKLRYSHSLLFDEGLRKLDDYNQEFFTAQLTIGVQFSL